MEGLANYLLKEAGLKQMLRLAEAVEKTPGKANGLMRDLPSASAYKRMLGDARANNAAHKDLQSWSGPYGMKNFANPEKLGLSPTAEVVGENRGRRMVSAGKRQYVGMSTHDAWRVDKGGKNVDLRYNSVAKKNGLSGELATMNNKGYHPEELAAHIEDNLSGGNGLLGALRATTNGRALPQSWRRARAAKRTLPLPG